MDSLCSAYLYILSSYHLFTGAISMFFPEFAMSFYRWFYRCEPPNREDLFMILKPWGALAAFAGFAGLFAALDPARYNGIVLGLLLLLLYRAYYRLVYARKLELLANIPLRRNLLNICLILLGVGILGGWCFGYWSSRLS